VRQRDAERREAVLKRMYPSATKATPSAVESHPRVDAHGPEHGSEEEQRRHGTEPERGERGRAAERAALHERAYRNAGYSKGHGKSPCAAPSPTIRQLPTHASIRGRSGR